MDLTLIRKEKIKDGIFGVIPELELVTLEHAYLIQGTIGIYEPKIPQGTYVCEKGIHKLAHMNHPFETYEIISVPDHTHILFHIGNYNADSEGCILVGTAIQPNLFPTRIMGSRIGFDLFLKAQEGVDSFKLIVQDS